MNDPYKKKHPDAKVPDDEKNAYYESHSKAFDDFLQVNTRVAQQAQGRPRDEIKKQLGEFKVIAARARKEGLDRS